METDISAERSGLYFRIVVFKTWIDRYTAELNEFNKIDVNEWTDDMVKTMKECIELQEMVAHTFNEIDALNILEKATV